MRTTAETIIGAVSDRIETQRSKLNTTVSTASVGVQTEEDNSKVGDEKINTTVNTADVGVQTEKNDDETTEQWAAKLNDFFLNYMPQP